MYGYIYETTCLINGMKYIGMHKWDKDSIDPNYLGSGLRLTHYSKDEFTINAWKQKLSNSLSGRKWMTKDNFSKQVKPEDIDKYLSDGWIYGRSKVTKKFND